MTDPGADRGDASSPTTEHDRRQAPRISLEVEIGVYSDSNFYEGFSQDISEGGLFVATHNLRSVGTVVDLEFVLPGGHEVRVQGEVRWVKDPLNSDSQPGVGVQFVGLEDEDKQAIQEFISNREPIFHDVD